MVRDKDLKELYQCTLIEYYPIIIYILIQFMNTLMYVLKIINIVRFFLVNLLKRDPIWRYLKNRE